MPGAYGNEDFDNGRKADDDKKKTNDVWEVEQALVIPKFLFFLLVIRVELPLTLASWYTFGQSD